MKSTRARFPVQPVNDPLVLVVDTATLMDSGDGSDELGRQLRARNVRYATGIAAPGDNVILWLASPNVADAIASAVDAARAAAHAYGDTHVSVRPLLSDSDEAALWAAMNAMEARMLAAVPARGHG